MSRVEERAPATFTNTVDMESTLAVTGVVTAAAGVVASDEGFINTNSYNLIADAADDVTITTLESGKEYYYGTATGAHGASDGDNAMTFALPTPTRVGEKIKITNTCATAHGKLIGFTVVDESAVTIRYVALDNGVFIEQGVTATGTHGTQNTMVKLAATHGQIGDTYECQSVSTTQWLLTINGRNGLIASGDIAPDPGNSGGYID
jgi:hypothetical protein